MTTTPRGERYRRDGDTWCLDLRVKHARQLFDLRDPAPFRERDLDPGVVEYLLTAVEEIPAGPLRIVIALTEEPEPSLDEDEITAALKAHFEHASELLARKIRGHLRQGQIATLVGLTVLTLFLVGAESIDAAVSTPRKILKEGLTIGGWVAIWRPVEHFLYDWWPFLDDRRTIRRLLDAEVTLSRDHRQSMTST